MKTLFLLAATTLLFETDVPVPMRDGIVLMADILRPEARGRYPAILIRTPYGKADESRDSFAIRAARAGYVVVAQDVRGRYGSGGTFDPYRQEGRDGYDSVEWVAALPYVNGRVGMAGLSYPGAVQWLAAMESPPHLVTIAPAMCFSTGRRFFYFGGTFDLSWIGWFYLNIAPDVRKRQGLAGPTTYEEARLLWNEQREPSLLHLPLIELPALKGVAPSYYEWLAHPDDGDYWSFADVRAAYDLIEIPALNLSGWHDEGYGPGGAIENYLGTKDNGSRLVLGPWTHGTPRLDRTREGELDFGVNAGLDYEALLMRWFDYWLKGEANGLDAEKPVSVFVMGENRWREADDWPIPRAEATAFYLGPDGGLAADRPAEGTRSYDYDPADPVIDPRGGAQGPFDQSVHESRDDVLVYESEPLSRDVEITGAIEAILYISSSARDTDFVVRLLDVHPDGRAFNLMSPTLEVERARYRNGEDTPELLEPGEIVSLRFDSMVTSNLFKAGHRIRLHVTSSFFPHFDRNLNTGASQGESRRMEVARQTIHHGEAFPSRIVLPIVPR